MPHLETILPSSPSHQQRRLQSWASFAWMHANAIHDLPNDACSVSLSPIDRVGR